MKEIKLIPYKLSPEREKNVQEFIRRFNELFAQMPPVTGSADKGGSHDR